MAEFLTPDGVWKTYIYATGSSGSYCFIAVAQQAAHPCIMPPNGSTTGKCQSPDIWHVQREESKTLSFCFFTFPDTAHCRGHMATVQNLRWGGRRDAGGKEMVAGRGKTALCHVVMRVSSVSSLHLFSAKLSHNILTTLAPLNGK